MYVIIDNYDSFTYNLYQYLSAITSSEVQVFRNDSVTLDEIETLKPEGIIISPGPGRPEDAGISVEVVLRFAGNVPLLGVCLGHQVIGHAFGASIIRAGKIVHGKTDEISLDGRGLFRGLLTSAVFTRYHSLVIQRDTIPADFEVTANSTDGEVMGIRHKDWVIEGVQFHPESIASIDGKSVLANFVNYGREPFLFKEVLERVMGGVALTSALASELMEEITEGRLNSARLSAILIALRMKGYTPDEIAGLASVLAHKKERVKHSGKVVDTCGTGGDGLSTFNISSLAALVVASCGVQVAKHGNRGVSSPTGSADFFKALGIDVLLTPQQAEELLEKTGFTFLFAPTYHGAMRHAASVRSDLGIKTIMNLLGPLVNPTEAEFQLIGVYDRSLCEPVARAAKLLGVDRVLVVHGLDGQDEMSVTGPTLMVEISSDNQLKETIFDPVACGIGLTRIEDLKGGNAEENAIIARKLLSGDGSSAICDAVALNAGAALYISGEVPDIEEGYRKARTAIIDGAAESKLRDIVTELNSATDKIPLP